MFLIFKGKVLSATPMHLRGLREDRPPAGRMSERTNFICHGKEQGWKSQWNQEPWCHRDQDLGKRGVLEPGKLSVS